jgi:hypothetical protein
MLLSSSIIAHAEVLPGVQVRSIQAVGNGCPQGSFSAMISPDGTTFSLLLDQYIAESTRQMTLDRKACQLRAEFSVPSGWQFSVVSADYRGFANVEGGAIATHQAIYSFDGGKPPNERPGFQDGSNYSFKAQNFNGPFQDNYFIHNEIDPRIAPWSPCLSNSAQTLFISTFLTARALNWRSPAFAQITLDSIDGQVQSQKFRFSWRRCSLNTRPTPPPPGQGQPGRPPVNPGRPPRFP